MKKLKIERWKDGWQIIEESNSIQRSGGIFLTFQEAYDKYSKMGNEHEHRERTKKKCERVAGTASPISQKNKDIARRNSFFKEASRATRKFKKWYFRLGFNGRSKHEGLT
tara:strand:+ start:416 stop:745 length:330 start_codon:yes stop_codon:yes gene_type:complete